MFLNIFFNRQNASTAKVLNFGLALLLKSPFDFDLEIKDNLLHRYSSLTEGQVIDHEKICIKAKHIGHDIIYEIMVKRLKAFDPMTKQELKNFYRQEFKNKFSWVNEKNLKSIYNLASYSLMRDGWDKFKK